MQIGCNDMHAIAKSQVRPKPKHERHRGKQVGRKNGFCQFQHGIINAGTSRIDREAVRILPYPVQFHSLVAYHLSSEN